ncbi:hypothetical protein [Brevibacillus agri]|uniref:hypothetical protein n=1 Tax=Brevibacillus agri TaxID=51101 RepID=UPI0018CD236C|nr:hypothetical protein [Brevibacillus agri]MBG9568473.1 hypothetical protein [Brevibacillus agri]
MDKQIGQEIKSYLTRIREIEQAGGIEAYFQGDDLPVEKKIDNSEDSRVEKNSTKRRGKYDYRTNSCYE